MTLCAPAFYYPNWVRSCFVTVPVINPPPNPLPLGGGTCSFPFWGRAREGAV